MNSSILNMVAFRGWSLKKAGVGWAETASGARHAFAWRDGQLASATLATKYAGPVRLRTAGTVRLTLDGKPVPLAELEGKVVVLSFGGTWVPHLTRELAALQRVASRYDSREVTVFWVSINSDQPGARHAASNEELREWTRRESVRLTVLRDPKMATYRDFELTAIPTIVILDRAGKVAYRLVGIGSEPGELFNDLVREIERLRK